MINYYLLTKPGIIAGNLMTVAAGFLLATHGDFNLTLFLAVLIGLGLIIASACVFNNYIDREIDRKMSRTKNRPLASRKVSATGALLFAVLLGLAGAGVLAAYTNLLTAGVAAVGFFVYVLLYSFLKSTTVLATAIGSIAGAIPPVVGYTAASGRLDLGAVILFAMMIFWQMPHFFSIALFNYDDYSAAGIPVLPVKKGIYQTKVHMTLYIAAFAATAAFLQVAGYAGIAYLTITITFALAWLLLSLKGFSTDDNARWGRAMFRLSLLTIAAVCLTIPL